MFTLEPVDCSCFSDSCGSTCSSLKDFIEMHFTTLFITCPSLLQLSFFSPSISQVTVLKICFLKQIFDQSESFCFRGELKKTLHICFQTMKRHMRVRTLIVPSAEEKLSMYPVTAAWGGLHFRVAESVWTFTAVRSRGGSTSGNAASHCRFTIQRSYGG